MRTSQIAVDCPTCGRAGAVLRLTEFITGDRSGSHEFTLTCAAGCRVSEEECLRVWTEQLAQPPPVD